MAGPPPRRSVDDWLTFLLRDGAFRHVVDLQRMALEAGYVNRGKDPDQPQQTFNSHMLGRMDKYEKHPTKGRTWRLRGRNKTR